MRQMRPWRICQDGVGSSTMAHERRLQCETKRQLIACFDPLLLFGKQVVNNHHIRPRRIAKGVLESGRARRL